MGQTRIDTSHIVVHEVYIANEKKKIPSTVVTVISNPVMETVPFYYYYNFFVVLSIYIYIYTRRLTGR